MAELNLTEVLDTALGSGDDSGKVNFLLLKVVLEAILDKLGIADATSILPAGDGKGFSLKEKVENLEKFFTDLTRPATPNTLISQSQKGEDAIKYDWEQNKLKKRVDANEEGVNKAMDILDHLTRRIEEISDKAEEDNKRIQSEQEEQDRKISAMEEILKELNEKFAGFLETDQQRSSNLEELNQKVDELDEKLKEQNERLAKCASWGQIDDSFKKDFFNENVDCSSCEKTRTEYPTYFNGLQTLSEYGKRIDEILKNFDAASDAIDSLKESAGLSENAEKMSAEDIEHYKALKQSTEELKKLSETILAGASDGRNEYESGFDSGWDTSTLEGHSRPDSLVDERLSEGSKDPSSTRVDQMQAEITKISTENERRKSRKPSYLGPGGQLKPSESMNLHEAISTLADPCLDLIKRVKEVEKISSENSLSLKSHSGVIGAHSITLENHTSQIENLLALRAQLEEMHSNFESIASKANNQSAKDFDEQALLKMQAALSGTEQELSRMVDLINQLQMDGNQKNQELEQLQALLRDLQERAAMRDYVMDNLEKKADLSDLQSMLSRDDLDDTANAIVTQLQDLIDKQAATEAEMHQSIQHINDEISCSTKIEEFNPFRDDIEKKLRSLRKKIEIAKKEDLEGLATAEGAAGFRKQLFNCISCDKRILMRMKNPILPESTAFPARLSLRPHTAYDIKTARKNSEFLYANPLKREGSWSYSNKVVEKDLERSRKLKENRLRQEINNYSFKTSTPRQMEGLPEYIERELKDYDMTNSIRQMESADLEGTDGILYRGRVQRPLPDIARNSPKDVARTTSQPELIAKSTKPI